MDDIREAYLQAVDVDYSYRLAKKMETFKTCLLYTSRCV